MKLALALCRQVVMPLTRVATDGESFTCAKIATTEMPEMLRFRMISSCSWPTMEDLKNGTQMNHVPDSTLSEAVGVD
jgi:hypothetical protein